MTALLTARGLRIGYRGRAILPPIELTVQPGELWALIGRNGGGKTTLMRTLLGLLPSVGGAIDRAPGLRLAYVPQRGDFDPSVPARVLDMVRGGLDQGWSFLDPLRLRRGGHAVQGALAAADVAVLRRQSFGTLSEGQKQRVLIARALVADPALLVLDEPTSAMDPVTTEAIFALLDRLRREGRAVMIASHTADFAPRFATHIALVDREHGVVQTGPAAEVLGAPAFLRWSGLPVAEAAHG